MPAHARIVPEGRWASVELMGDEQQWATVDDYLGDALVAEDDVLRAAVADSRAAGLPQIQVSPTYGRLLQLLVMMSGAESVLEVGTLAAYSTIWLARGLPAAGGRVVTLEAEARHAQVARANLTRAGLDGVVELHEGPALETLPQLAAEGDGPFDLVFVDADKPSNPEYVRWALELTGPGSVLVVDNVVRSGMVADAGTDDAAARGVRRMMELVAGEPRLQATALQTVGVKGWDGFLLALVTAPR